MSDINALQEKVISFRDERDWGQFHNPKDLAISLILEAGELLEHFQWKNEEEARAHIQDSKQEISEELADVLVYLLSLSHDLQIDLSEALQDKLMKNAQKYPVAKAKGSHKKYNEL